MRAMRGWLLLPCLLALASCVSVPRVKQAPPGELSAQARADAMLRQQARESTLSAMPSLAFSARAALSSGREGGNGRIEWRQTGDRYEITLSAPVTRQSWKLSGDATSAQLEGIQGGTRTGADGSQLLREATRLEIPVGALAAWASGRRADEASFGPAALQFAADGRIRRLEQAGWVVDYLGWQDTDLGNGQTLQMPSRIDAQLDSTVAGATATRTAKVRLAIDNWSWAREAP